MCYEVGLRRTVLYFCLSPLNFLDDDALSQGREEIIHRFRGGEVVVISTDGGWELIEEEVLRDTFVSNTTARESAAIFCFVSLLIVVYLPQSSLVA